MEEPEYDKVTQASLNGIYVKAQEMDRGHNDEPAPSFMPPGARGDAESHASTHASDAASASTHASDAASSATHASDAASASCFEVNAQTHASEAGVQAGGADFETHASTHASDGV